MLGKVNDDELQNLVRLVLHVIMGFLGYLCHTLAVKDVTNW